MIHDLRWLVRDGERILQYNTCAAGDVRDWHDVLPHYPAFRANEVREPSVTITRSQFWAAVESLHFTEKGIRNAVDVKALARRLGLENDK